MVAIPAMSWIVRVTYPRCLVTVNDPPSTVVGASSGGSEFLGGWTAFVSLAESSVRSDLTQLCWCWRVFTGGGICHVVVCG